MLELDSIEARAERIDEYPTRVTLFTRLRRLKHGKSRGLFQALCSLIVGLIPAAPIELGCKHLRMSVPTAHEKR